MKRPGYDTVTYPRSRLATFDVGRIGRKKHTIVGLLEVDVTQARTAIRERIRGGADLSFTAWLVKVIGQSIAEHPLAHGINSRGQEQILFHDVDISLPLEKDVKGIRVPLPMLITAVNRKSVTQIKQEIQSAREQSVDGAEDYVLNGQQAKGSTAFFFKLPGLLRGLVWRYLLGNPFRRKKYMGTAIITNIGMSGGISAWIIPKSIHNLAFGMGTIVRKPGVVGNRIEIRDILHLTVQLDHDVIDGAPAARFTAGLVRNIESARFLDAMDPDS